MYNEKRAHSHSFRPQSPLGSLPKTLTESYEDSISAPSSQKRAKRIFAVEK
jgi:hypothetical protein